MIQVNLINGFGTQSASWRYVLPQVTSVTMAAHLDLSISIVSFILSNNFFPVIHQILVLPRTVFARESFHRNFASRYQTSNNKMYFLGNPTSLCFQSQKDHSLIFATSYSSDEKWLISSRNSFSSLSQRISFSCSLTHLRSMLISFNRLIGLE